MVRLYNCCRNTALPRAHLPATRKHVEQLCDLLAEMGLTIPQISGVGLAVIGMVASNFGCGGVIPAPVACGELVHDARKH